MSDGIPLPLELLPESIGVHLTVSYDDDGNAHVNATLDALPTLVVRTALAALETKLSSGDIVIANGTVAIRGEVKREGGRLTLNFIGG